MWAVLSDDEHATSNRLDPFCCWWCAEINKYYVVSRWLLIFCCTFPPCIIRPAGQGIFKGPAGFFSALCDQLAVTNAPQTVGLRCAHCSSEFKHVTPGNVIAWSNPPLGLDAPIQAAASQCLLLDVPVFHRQSYFIVNRKLEHYFKFFIFFLISSNFF